MSELMKIINARLPERWYRDIWLFVVTGIVLVSLMAQAKDRKTSTLANIEARYSDCVSSNATLTSLRQQVEISKVQRPLLFKFFPQLHDPQAVKLIIENEQRELQNYAPRNCITYALEALPGHAKKYPFPANRFPK